MSTPLPGPELRDIHLPPEPAWWPPAPGWWILTALLLVSLWLAWRWLAPRWRRYRIRQRVLAELDGLQAAYSAHRDSHVLVVALSRFTRRLVRAYAPQAVALSGKQWREFLAEASGDRSFVDGPAMALATAPYQPASAIDTAALVAAVRRLAERMQQARKRADV